MTKEEYIKALEVLRKTAKLKEKQLHNEFALSNSSVKVGDIVTDHIGSVRVQAITTTIPLCSPLPCCVYLGEVLNKNGKESKRKQSREVYQCNIKAGAN